jgi:hypothetical protein
MTIDKAKQIVYQHVINPIIEFEIERNLFIDEKGRDKYNSIVRNNVENKNGVYLWVNSENNEIIYIGMAGKIKSNGKYGSHSIQKRLLAARGKDKMTKKYVQTNDYIRNIMTDKDIQKIKFYIMYSKIGEPPAFLEALLLYEFYKINTRLPMLNSSF